MDGNIKNRSGGAAKVRRIAEKDLIALTDIFTVCLYIAMIHRIQHENFIGLFTSIRAESKGLLKTGFLAFNLNKDERQKICLATG
ncbi:MAG: hypothetical protein J5933_02705 [Clostridia bacterium]|nr:hypothetical protein [Clostridia bacterium]